MKSVADQVPYSVKQKLQHIRPIHWYKGWSQWDGTGVMGEVLKPFKVYKKVHSLHSDYRNNIVTLMVPEGALIRTPARWYTWNPRNKCRVSHAIVLDGNGKSAADPCFTYHPNTMVFPTSTFDFNLIECSIGIHVFLTKQEAEDYHL